MLLCCMPISSRGDLKLFAQNKHQDVGSDCILDAPTCVLPSAAGIQDGVMATERSPRSIYRRYAHMESQSPHPTPRSCSH